MRPTAKARPIHRNDEAEDDSDDSPTGHTPVPPATGSATSSGDAKAAPKTSPPAKGPPVKAKAAVPTPSFKASRPPVPDPANAPHSHFFPPLGGSWPHSLLGAGGGGVHVYFPPYVATPALHHVAAYDPTSTRSPWWPRRFHRNLCHPGLPDVLTEAALLGSQAMCSTSPVPISAAADCSVEPSAPKQLFECRGLPSPFYISAAWREIFACTRQCWHVSSLLAYFLGSIPQPSPQLCLPSLYVPLYRAIHGKGFGHSGPQRSP